MKSLTVAADKARLDEVVEMIEGILEDGGCGMRTILQIRLAVEEIFVNIAKYAYTSGTGKVKIQAEVTDDPEKISITFIDQGVPYDPLQRKDPDVTLSAAERKIGGLGIYMTKNIMDYMHYDHIDGCNVLTMKKLL